MGVFNRIYPLGDDLVLRVPRDHPAFVAAARKESVAVPAAREAGVRTPRMVSFDDTGELLPVPYALKVGRPVVGLGGWKLGDHVVVAGSPAGAGEAAFGLLGV